MTKKIVSPLLILFFIHFIQPPGYGQTSGLDNLLQRLDIKQMDLDTSHKNKTEISLSLLQYFRDRKNVHHPVNRQGKNLAFGNSATPRDISIANNALKHILVGQPAYDPVFCGEDIDWNTRPVPDREWVWQLNRMYFWSSMAKTYWHTGDEKYALEWCNQFLDWVEDNPNDEAHTFAWRSIEAGIRGHSWTALWQHFIDSQSMTPRVVIAFLNSCFDHAEYLMTKYSSSSNWALMEAEGLAFISILFPEFHRSEGWCHEAISRLNKEIDIQVYDDGHQRELAMGYHIGCIRWFYRTYEFAALNGRANAFSEHYLTRLEQMCEVPLKLGLPDGTNAQFGDAWRGKPGQHRDRFVQWAEIFGRQDFLYLGTDGAQGSPPSETAFALPISGLYSMRSDWDKDAIAMVLKCGPDGGGHCQPDNGTFVIYAGGKNLTPDAGSFIYSGNPEGRAWFRQTKIHQTLTLNGQNSAYEPKLIFWEPGQNDDILVVENESYPGLTHRRAVFFVDKKYFVVVDDAYGATEGEVDIHFQFAPGEVIFDTINLSARTAFKDGWNLHIRSATPNKTSMSKEEGQVSFVYTQKEPRPAFRFRKIKQPNRGIRFITILTPYHKDLPLYDAAVSGTTGIGGDDLEINVGVHGSEKILRYSIR